MCAPCGQRPLKFIEELIADGIVTKPKREVIAFLREKQWLERVEFALSMYDEERHFIWSEYKQQMVDRMDMRLGERWRK